MRLVENSSEAFQFASLHAISSRTNEKPISNMGKKNLVLTQVWRYQLYPRTF
jgi:hypothetical protein